MAILMPGPKGVMWREEDRVLHNMFLAQKGGDAFVRQALKRFECRERQKKKQRRRIQRKHTKNTEMSFLA